jgi:hypothetical protein
VLWPLRTHDLALGNDGQAAETITVGPSIWQRQASGPERLDAEPYVFAGDVATWGGGAAPSGAGAARLPSWLAATTERTFQSERSGRSTFAATLPADRFGTVQEGAPAVDGTVELTVDADGVPLRIEVETADDETGDDPAWRLAVDIGGLGDPVVIDLPNGELAAVTEGPSPADVRAAGIAAPVELAQLPDEWMLAVIMLRDDPGADCASLELSYGAIGPTLAGFLTLQVMPPQCATPAGPDRPLHAGAFSGEARLFSEGGGGGALTDGRTAIEYISDLPTEEVLRLLETLEPYDPTTRPTALAAASARG